MQNYSPQKIWQLKIVRVFIYITLLIPIVIITTQFYFGVEEIGHMFEKGSYYTEYYAYLSKSNDKTFNNYVTAYLYIYHPRDPDAGNPYIKLNKVVFKTNESIIFSKNQDNSYYDGCLLQRNINNLCIDLQGNNWYVKLSDIKVKK